jgi:EmrB/QacA subfamily drug resistance transporter
MVDANDPEPSVASPAMRLAPRTRLFAFLSLMTAMFMSMLDVQIVSTALPTIVGEFGHLERFGWVGSAYLLASSSVMPIYGKLGDLFGRKQVLIAAVAIFIVGSLACGLATSMGILIAARVLQALGGGGIAVSVFSINADLFAPRERARYQSYSSLVLMLAGAVGPALGGAMSDWFGWRSIFLINLPIGLGALLALSSTLPRVRPSRTPKIDVAGALLLACVVASVVLWADAHELFGGMLSKGGLGVLAFGASCLIGWIWVERRAPEPVIPLSLFENLTVILLLFVSLVSGAVGIGLSNYWALFLQSARQLSPSHAGLLFMPITAGIALGSVSAGRAMARTGDYKPFAIASCLGGAMTLGLVSAFGVHAPLWALGLLMAAQGVSIGMGQQVPVLGVQNAARRGDVGAATGAVALTRMAGASIGISLYGSVLSVGVAEALARLPQSVDATHLDPSAVAALAPELRAQVAGVYASACVSIFLVGAAFVAAGALAALALPRVRLPRGG